MRVVVLADALFAQRELSLLSLLELGLADEGVSVVHATPRSSDAHAQQLQGVFRKVVTFTPSAFAWTRKFASHRLAIDLLRQDDDVAEPVDIIHVFGGSLWKTAIDLAGELRAGLVLEIWRHGMLHALHNVQVALPERTALLAPDASIERQVKSLHLKHPVHLAPWGLLTTPSREIFEPARAPAVMVVGSGRVPARFEAALAGVRAVLDLRPDMLIFCDALAARRANLWAAARRLGLLDRLSLIEDLDGRRDLLLEGDILLHPDAGGEQRSVLLQAMAGGLAVVATHDERVSMLIDGVTARTVKADTAAAWEAVLRDILTHQDHAKNLGASARQWVQQHRRASAHIRAVLSAYQTLSPSSGEFAASTSVG
jgi:glycosyltransferase involved in cell wall biosynthesis